MENLDKALKSKKLEDLVKTKETAKSNLIEPTKQEIEAIVAMLAEGKAYREIKLAVRRTETEKRTKKKLDEEGNETDQDEEYDHQLSSKGFSYGQIREVDLARLAKVSELQPKEESEELI